MSKKRNSNMLIPTLIMFVLAIVLLYIGYARGQGESLVGLTTAMRMIIRIFPILVFALVVGGMVQVLLPHELLSRWIGAESGLRGILVGTMAGGIAPGGPYVSLPIVAGLLQSGAGIGTLVAFLTAWSLWAVARLPMDVGILGWRFTLIRLACTFFFPPIAGLIAQTVFRGVRHF